MAAYFRPDLQESSDTTPWRCHLKTLLPLLVIYLILAFYGLDRQSLWEDEFSSLIRVTSSIPFWRDGHGFLYYALLGLWAQLGTSEFILRSLSVLLGAVAVCLFYALGHTLLTRWTAVVATVLFATSPYLIWYSQEARYITLTIVCTLLTMYSFQQLMLRRRSEWWLVYGSTALLAFFSFLSTLFLPIVQGLYLLGCPYRRAYLKKWVVCQILVFALFGWWFVHGTHFWQVFMESRIEGQQDFRDKPKLLPFRGEWNNVRFAVIPYTFFTFSGGFSLGPPPRELYADRSVAPLVPYAPMLIGLSILFGGLLLSGLFALGRQRDARFFLSLWIGVPILGVFGIAKVLDVFYDVRYVAMALPAYVLIIAAGIVRFRRFALQMMLIGAVLAVHGFALANYYFNPKYAREDTRSAAQFLESAAGSQDVALVVGTLSSLPHYYRGTLPFVDFSTLERANDSVTGWLEKVTSNHDRLWLVQIRPWQIDRGGRVKAALDKSYDMVEHQHFPGIDVHGYQISK